MLALLLVKSLNLRYYMYKTKTIYFIILRALNLRNWNEVVFAMNQKSRSKAMAPWGIRLQGLYMVIRSWDKKHQAPFHAVCTTQRCSKKWQAVNTKRCLDLGLTQNSEKQMSVFQSPWYVLLKQSNWTLLLKMYVLCIFTLCNLQSAMQM